MKPRFFDILGHELVVVWDDGHESYYPLEALRRSCPCANCSGEADLFGRLYKGPPIEFNDRSFEVDAIEPVGNYGIQFNWSDGHGWGIWTFERLRELCPCAACHPPDEKGDGAGES